MTAAEHRRRGEELAARAANGCRHEPEPETAGMTYLWPELFDRTAEAVDVAKCRQCGRWYELDRRAPGLLDTFEEKETTE